MLFIFLILVQENLIKEIFDQAFNVEALTRTRLNQSRTHFWVKVYLKTIIHIKERIFYSVEEKFISF